MKVCSFYGKNENEVKRMITSNYADICEECILRCMNLIIKEQAEYKEIKFKKDNK